MHKEVNLLLTEIHVISSSGKPGLNWNWIDTLLDPVPCIKEVFYVCFLSHWNASHIFSANCQTCWIPFLEPSRVQWFTVCNYGDIQGSSLWHHYMAGCVEDNVPRQLSYATFQQRQRLSDVKSSTLTPHVTHFMNSVFTLASYVPKVFLFYTKVHIGNWNIRN